MTGKLEAGIKELVEEFQASGKPCLSMKTVLERRNSYAASAVLGGDSPKLANEFLDILNKVQIKIYKPTSKEDLPITIYFHGGCFISGGFETHQAQLRQIAQQSNSIVICIKYRLAPEYTYPAAHDDVYQAVLGIKEHGSKYGGDTKKIVFMGDSAGGHLALATALRLRNHSLWQPKKLILIYPMLDPKGGSQSYKNFGSNYIITAKMLLSGFELYTNGDPKVIEEPELNLLRSDFSGLPSTTIVSAEFDPLRDEGEQLYKLMHSQGIDVHIDHYLGVIHGFFQLSSICDSARKCINSMSKQIKSI
ncbi:MULTISPECIES: alpha/beta hydrolase [Pseudoalteromonas]|uniref:Lipase n=1 Tax=Pseudoalteromonas amylolytica TaxID=1859457 RepID=A0A1S1MUL0_9GAMM|nr:MULTISPECIES: alpha/beta hydrolase [Pseudoalteromonas]OHU88412.1 lipase [Pseudoalteromonas sp. JW3]OHU90255.1 lipase [Pseudoalteromonas amylolytica]